MPAGGAWGRRGGRKPLPTLMPPLKPVDLARGAPAQAQSERSDVTAVPAMGVIAEAMVALVLAQAMGEKFGGDAVGAVKRNYHGHQAQVRARTPEGAAAWNETWCRTGRQGAARRAS